jgi:hypothetical protein
VTDPEVLALLREILAGQRELRDALRELAEHERPRQPQDLGADVGEHLRAISAAVGDRVFSVAELLAHAAIPEGEALRAAIVGLLGSLNGKRLGKFLRRIEGQDIAGLCIERIGEDRSGVAWILRVCAGVKAAKPAMPMALR